MNKVNLSIEEDIKQLKGFKREFVDQEYSDIHESTKRDYVKKLLLLQDIEEELKFGLGIEDYSKTQCITLLRRFGAKSIQSLQVQLTPIKDYVTFVNRANNLEGDINAIFTLTTSDLESCVNKNKTTILTRCELYEEVGKLTNDHDKIVPLLIFEGILGKSLSEVINLKEEDVHVEDKEIMLNDRIIKIKYEKFWEIYKKAIKQELYDNNKENKCGDRFFLFNTLLVESPYVVKQREKTYKQKGSYKVGRTYLANRIDEFKEVLDRNITATELNYAGILERICAYELKKNFNIDVLDIINNKESDITVEILDNTIKSSKPLKGVEVKEYLEDNNESKSYFPIYKEYEENRDRFMKCFVEIYKSLKDE